MSSKRTSIPCSVCDQSKSSKECTVASAFPVPLCMPCQARGKSQTNKPFGCGWCGVNLRPQAQAQASQAESSDTQTSSEKEKLCRILIPCGVAKCRRKYCTVCITKHFGATETRRIHTLGKYWQCFACDQAPLLSLSERKWNIAIPTHKKKSKQSRVINADITNGRERNPIPVINNVDDSAPFPFTYISERIGVSTLKNRPDFTSCCSCTDNCADKSKCECAQAAMNNGSFAYNCDGLLVNEKSGGIYECNYKCLCNVNHCPNRVVGKGPQIPLEIFRCEPSGKGWGLRSKMDIQPGTFIADYIGEVIDECVADRRGVAYGDEYLFTLDAYGRSRGCQRLHDLGLKSSQLQDRAGHYLPMKEEVKDDAAQDSSDNSNVFNVPIFVSYASKEFLDDALGPALVSSILKSTSVRVDAASAEVRLVGTTAIQRQHLKSHSAASALTITTSSLAASFSSSSSSSSSSVGAAAAAGSKMKKKKLSSDGGDQIVKKKAKKSKASEVAVSTIPVHTHRQYCAATDEDKLIKRGRLLALREARYVCI
jgi:hypothetical protein